MKWAYIRGLCEKAIYGGRITNVQDIAILTTYLRCIFTSDNVNWKNDIPGMANINSGDVKVREKRFFFFFQIVVLKLQFTSYSTFLLYVEKFYRINIYNYIRITYYALAL